jgi:hypothetical protein
MLCKMESLIFDTETSVYICNNMCVSFITGGNSSRLHGRVHSGIITSRDFFLLLHIISALINIYYLHLCFSIFSDCVLLFRF